MTNEMGSCVVIQYLFELIDSREVKIPCSRISATCHFVPCLADSFRLLVKDDQLDQEKSQCSLGEGIMIFFKLNFFLNLAILKKNLTQLCLTTFS